MIWVGTKDYSRGFIRLAEGACILALLFFTIYPLTFAQVNPLKPSNMPTIDTNCADYPVNVWVSGSLYKQRQDSGSAPSCPGTYADKWIVIYGTQNEFVDFQVHWHDTGSGTTGLNITVSAFTQTSPSSYTIQAPSSSATDIIVYREAYLDITTPSATAQTGNPPANNTWLGTGYWPDILIPTTDPYYHQTTNAWPFTVAAGQNQSAWIDVHIPQAAPAGYYKGTVTVQTGCPNSCATVATLPIILGVWQWPASAGGSMPSTPSITSFNWDINWEALCVQSYGGDPNCSNYPGAGGNTYTAEELMLIDESVLFLDHRINQLSVQGFDSTNYPPLLNGTSTKTILQGSKLQLFDFSNSSTPSQSTIQSLATQFQSSGWTNTLFEYVQDEPPASGSPSTWSFINSSGTTLHSVTPPVPGLVTTNLATATANNALNSIDWMVPIINDMDPPGGSNQRSSYSSWLAGSSGPARRLWIYQSCESEACGSGNSNSYNVNWPNYMIDGTAISNRVMGWMDYYYNVSGDLYYNATICWGLSTCSNGGDPWKSLYYSGGNGDGTLLYPGRQTGSTIGPENVGTTYPIYLPSIRLKNQRDGLQDYEYLNVLNSKGQGTLVSNVVSSWITNAYGYNNNPTAAEGVYTSDLTDARYALGTAMNQLTYPAVLLPPASLTGTLQ